MEDIAKGAGNLAQQRGTRRDGRRSGSVEDANDVQETGPGSGCAVGERARPHVGAVALIPRVAKGKLNTARKESPRWSTKGLTQGLTAPPGRAQRRLRIHRS